MTKGRAKKTWETVKDDKKETGDSKMPRMEVEVSPQISVDPDDSE